MRHTFKHEIIIRTSDKRVMGWYVSKFDGWD